MQINRQEEVRDMQIVYFIKLFSVPGPNSDGLGGMQSMFMMMMLWICFDSNSVIAQDSSYFSENTVDISMDNF